jgi:PST family polysaccharide transporter
MDEKAVRGIPWTMLTFGASKVITVLTTLVLARLLSPADFGLFALATLGISLLSIFNGNWLGATLIVRDDLDDRARGTVLTLLLVAGLLMAGALAAIAPLVAEVFEQPRLTDILFALSAILTFSGVNWFYEMVMQRELEFRRRFAQCDLLGGRRDARRAGGWCVEPRWRFRAQSCRKRRGPVRARSVPDSPGF